MLPGLGNRPGADGGRLDGGRFDGARPGQLPNRTPQERRDGLQDRLSSREDIGDRSREDWQDHRDDVRQDWQDHYDDFYDRHDDWHHGCWHGNAGDWWNHMWDDHTALMAFGTTMWGVNRLAYGFGYWGYENPYYTESYPIDGGYALDYSQPLAVETAPVEMAPVEAAPADAPAPGMADFDVARQAFYGGDYAAALASTNKALAALPNDPIIHEFRSLVLFAQGKYNDAAAGLYSVLSVGPGWDWTTLSSLYPNVDAYTRQLRALETVVKQNPDAAAARFVLAYHYLTMGSKDAAAAQLKILYQKTPQDPLVKELLLMTGGPEAIGQPATSTEAAPTAAPAVNAANLVGNWNSAGQNGTKFELGLSQDGNFSWTYSQDGKSQTVKGVYALDGNVLAMEPESGGVMLAEVSEPQGGAFSFAMLGAPPGDPGLKFAQGR
jgi:tetratricopeptide (TPR) repeat protein